MRTMWPVHDLSLKFDVSVKVYYSRPSLMIIAPGAFSVIVKTDGSYAALIRTRTGGRMF